MGILRRWQNISFLVAFMLAASLAAVIVPAKPVRAATTLTVPVPYATIMAAINAANDGDTILVSDGTYTEDLDPGATAIEIPNLTIRSVNGSASTTIQLVGGADGLGIDLGGGAGNFTLGGAPGQGFTILSGAGTNRVIQLANAPSGVTISYNTISTVGHAVHGVSVGAAGATNLTVSNNTFIAETGDLSIWGPEMVGVTVSNNAFTGPGGPPASGWAVQFAGVTGASTISSNNITGYGGGIAITNGGGTSGLDIRDNTISDCAKGIGFLEYSQVGTPPANMTTVTVTRNTLATNTVGLYVGNGTHVLASNFTINANSFSQSTTYGLQNAHATEAVTAENNWWGANDGPDDDALVINGSGDKISTKVDADPWLVIGVTANPTNITVGGAATSVITADMTKNSDAATPGVTVPDGTQITFTTDKGSIGSLTTNKTTTNGIATATLTSSNIVETATVTASAPPHTAAATATTTVNFVQGAPGPPQQVASVTGTGTVTFSSSIGTLGNLTSTTVAVAPGVPPEVAWFPHGLFSFTVTNIGFGSTVIVTIVFPAPLPVGVQYWSYQNGTWVNCTALLGDDDGDNVLTLTLTDGGLKDADGVANGVINDPGGPAVPATAVVTSSSSSPQVPEQFVPAPARLTVKYLNVQPKKAQASQPVTIFANIANSGDESDSYTATLKIDGQVEEVKTGRVGGHVAVPIKFTVYRANPGNYSVDINGQKASFTIIDPNSNDTSRNLPLIGFIVCAIAAIAVATIMVMRRRASC